jgi:hypothetical protein
MQSFEQLLGGFEFQLIELPGMLALNPSGTVDR